MPEPEKQGYIDPIYTIQPAIIERLVTLPPTDPNYPLRHSLVEDYVGSDAYIKKHSLAVALINDGRFQDLRFLVNRFILSGQTAGLEVENLRDDVQRRVQESLLKRGDPKAVRAATKDLEHFVQDISEGTTLDAQSFRKLVGLFGASRAVDILYKYRPEYRGLPVEAVKSILSEYIGDFLSIRGELKVDDVKTGLDYLSEPNFREGLVEVVKDSCLAAYNKSRKMAVQVGDLDVIQEYINDIEAELASLDNPELAAVLGEVRAYYVSAFKDFNRPSVLVGAIKEGRTFPDLNQRINIKEISDKRRVLIADEMGVGKSASAILTKEVLGLGTALVITPSNVVDTWRTYLSDKKSADDKQIGYFKEGAAPRVLVVEDLNSLKGVDIASYDYVVISQEKLREQYVDDLEAINFDMLIVDEVHKLKNLEDGKRASSLLRLARKVEGENKYMALLSGTPVPNKVEDVAMLLKLLYPERFEEMDNKELVHRIVYGDAVDIRSLLLPRMQMKSLAESVEMPNLSEDEVYVVLSPEERDIYEALLEEDELMASVKLKILRQYLLNPEIFDLTPAAANSKVEAVSEKLGDIFSRKRKAVMFVNGYIEGVIRGDKTIIERLGLPEDVEVRVIEGTVDDQTRSEIQKDLNTSDKKILVIVSGQTADVGVDFSGGEAVIFYNEPWTKYEFKQQLGRVYRPGLSTDLECYTFITQDTVEEGVHLYIEAKYKAVEKLLRGIPLSDIEKTLVEKSEEQKDPNLEVNPELAKYYFSAWDKMMRKFFRYTREIGEKDFMKFLEKFGKEYADCYVDLGNRSYQSNAGRVTGTLISEMVKEAGQNPDDLTILDIASGPEVLKKHISEELQDQVVSMDINEHHFQNHGSNRIVGSFSKLPLLRNSVDYANLSLALHYSKFAPSKEEYERLEVLAEMNRVLKAGGKAVINLVYSLRMKDETKFKSIASILGFEVVEECSGEAVSDQHYKSKVFTLRKIKDISSNIQEVVDQLGKEYWKGLKFTGTGSKVKESRRIIKDFSINGNPLQIKFNPEDQLVLEEEEAVFNQGEGLKAKYGEIQDIPREEVIGNGFVRFYNGKRYLLFRKLEKGSGAVIIR